MNKYFIKTNVSMRPKNKAWDAAQAFAYSHDCTLIVGDELLNDYVKRVKDKVFEINKEHPKCKELSFSSQKLLHKLDAKHVTVAGDLVFSFSIYSIKTELSDN